MKNNKKKGKKNKKGGSNHNGNIVCIDYSKGINSNIFWSFCLFSFISIICSILQNKIFNKTLGTGCILEPNINADNTETVDNNCFQSKPINLFIYGIGIISGVISGIIQLIFFFQTVINMY